MTTAARACLACRTPLPEEAHFCLNCGTATPTEPGVPPRTADPRPEVAAVNRMPESAMAAYRALGDDDSAIGAFERAVDGPRWEWIYPGQMLAVLGPELSARPRVRAAMQRFIGRRHARP